MEAMRQKAAA